MTKFIIITAEISKGHFVASAMALDANGVPTSAYLRSNAEVSRAVAKSRLLAQLPEGSQRVAVDKTWRLE